MKLKDKLQKEQDNEFEQDLSFEEWLDFFIKEPTKKEIDDMEKQIDKSNQFKATNNISYHPFLQGA